MHINFQVKSFFTVNIINILQGPQLNYEKNNLDPIEVSFRTPFIWKESDESSRFARYLDALCGLLCKSFIERPAPSLLKDIKILLICVRSLFSRWLRTVYRVIRNGTLNWMLRRKLYWEGLLCCRYRIKRVTGYYKYDQNICRIGTNLFVWMSSGVQFYIDKFGF